MRSKAHLYVLLLLISIAIRIFFYCFPFEGTDFEPIAKTHILYDVIFFAIMISLLGTLNDRKWLIGLTWITMFVSIAYTVLEWIGDESSLLTRRQHARAYFIIGFTITAFYICIFFARKSPARIFLRIMAAVATLPDLFDFIVVVLHNSKPNVFLASPLANAIISIVLNLLLALAVWRTPELRRPKYADFLE